ncbi:sensor histidine kinase [Bacteroidota bacterium]
MKKDLKSIAIHMAGWIIYLLLLTWLLSDFRTFAEAFTRSLYIIIFQCFIFYLNYFLLLPKLFEQRKYVLFFLCIAAVLILGLIIFYYVDRFLFPREIRSMIDRGFPGDLPEGTRQRLGLPRREGLRGGGMAQKALLFNGFHILFILFISTIYRNLVVNRKRDREELQLKNQVLEAESKMLKWQVNPHFLFNTLNNIYSMSQLKSDQTPEAIHRLSNMLRYVLYDCNEKDVLLEKEISYLKSYIELQRLKDESLYNVTYDFKSANARLKIAPLLFISFVENSFKHSRIEDTDHSWIRIGLNTDGKRVIFRCENSMPEGTITKDATAGIGLENVKRRLQLLYPGKHQLMIEKGEEIFSVTLILETDED